MVNFLTLLECHCKLNFIRGDFISRLTFGKLDRYDYCSQPSLIQTPVAVTTIDRYWFAARNIHEDRALAKLAKISRTGIKVGLQYVMC